MNWLQRPFFPALEISNFHDIVIALEQVDSMMIQVANSLVNPSTYFSFLDSLRSGRSSMYTPVYTVDAAVCSPQLSSCEEE